MAKRLRKIRRLLAAAVVILCLLVALVLIGVHTPPVRRYVARQVISLLAQQQIDVNTDELGYNLFNASIALRNINVRSPKLPDAPPFATVGRLRINLSLVQLLRGRYVVESGSIDDVKIHYFVDHDGRDNLPGPPTDPNEPRKRLDYLISALTVSNARLRYENRREDIDIELPVSSMNVAGNQLTDRHQIQFDSSDGSVRFKDRAAAIDRLSGNVEMGDDDLTMTKVELQSVGSRAELTGSISRFEAPQADLVVRAIVDAMRGAPLADIHDTVGGRLSIDATAKGPLATPVVNAHVTGSALQFRDLRDVELDAQAVYDLATRRTELPALRVHGPWGALNGSGKISLDSSGSTQLQADISGLDAAAVMRGLKLPYAVASRVDGSVNAEWPGLEILKAKGDAKATLTPTSSAATRSLLPIGGRLRVHGNGGRVDAQLAQVGAAGAQVNGQLAIREDLTLQGTLKGRTEDVGRLAASIEAFLGRSAKQSSLPTPLKGSVDLDTTIAGTIDAPTASAALKAPALVVGDVRDVALTSDVLYTPSALTIRSADVMWQQATAHLDGRVGLARDRRLDLTFKADAVEVSSLLKAANREDLPMSGTLSASGTVGGTIDRPAGTMMTHGSNLVASEEPIGSLSADLSLAGREVEISRLDIDKPQPDGNGKVMATGSFNLDTKRYSVNVRSEGVRLVGLKLSDTQRIRGVVQLDAQGSGTVSSPEGKAHLVLDSLELDRSTTAQLGKLTIDAVAANKQATITATSEQFKLDVEALVALTKPWPTTVKVRADNLDLAALPLENPQPITGQLRATVEASGDLAEPERGQATMALESFSGSWNGQPFSVTSPSDLRYADERLAIERLEVKSNESVLTLSGALPLTDRAGQGDLMVDLKSNLAELNHYLPRDANVATDGALSLTGSLRGTLKAIDPDLVITLENGLVLSPMLEPGFSKIGMRARINNGEATVEQLAANWGTATLEGSGRIPLEAVPPLPVEIPRMGGPATFKASVKGLDPAALPGASARLGGKVSLDAEVSAARPELAALDGKITFPEFDLVFGGLTLNQQQPSSITIGSGTATIDQFSLEGSAGKVKTTGRVGLVGERALDVSVDGNLNVAAITIVTNKVRAEGDSALQLHARGTVSAPELDGSVTLTGATAAMDEPNVAAENINGRIELAGRRVSLTELKADLNGGTLEASGNLTVGDGDLSEVNLEITTNDVAFDAPLDLRSLTDSKIRVTRDGDDILVSGQVTIDEAGLTGDVNFDTGLLAAMTARPKLDLTEKRNPLLERLRFAIDVDTAAPILVDNNLAHAEITTDVRVVGTPYETGLTGRMNILEGGEIRLNERKYQVQRGAITFVDDRRIFPSFDLELNTSARNYDITIAVAGTPGDTKTTLTSDPDLPEPDIMAMLVTGRTLDDMRGEEFEVAKEQVLSYLTGRVGSTLGRGLQKATGLSEVRIEPTLIANEADPGARLTVGQDLTQELKLVYSTNLTDSNDQIWVAEYDVTRRFQTRAVRQDDASYRLDFHHDLRFGGVPAPRRQSRIRPKVTEVAVTASAGQDVSQVREKFKVKEGDDFDFFAVRKGLDRLEQSMMDQGYLQSKVRIEREVDDDAAKLTLRVTRGPLVEIQFDGVIPPRKVQEEVRTQWHRGVFDKQRGDAGVSALRRWLMDDNYLQPKIQSQIDNTAEDRRHVTFHVEPGSRSDKVVLAFEGASAIHPDDLDKIIAQQKLERRLFTDPVVVTELLEKYYREEGYLVAEIDQPRYEFSGGLARVVMAIREGPAFTVRRVTVSGNAVYTNDVITSQLPIVTGDPFLPAGAERALDKIRDLYWAKGYNDVRSDYRMVLDRTAGLIDLAFTIREGPQTVIADISVTGNQKTSNRLVREQVPLSTSEPLDLSLLAKSRRNLYNTGAFSLVNITPETIEKPSPSVEKPSPSVAGLGQPAPDDRGGAQPPQTTTAAASTPSQDGQNLVRVNVTVREVQPFQLRYGASYDTERGVGGLFDISNHNSLGGARVVGLRARYDKQLHEGRIYINQPALSYLPFKTTGSIYYREDLSPPTVLTRAFNANRKGVSIQQERELRDAYVWSWGYRYERARTLEPVLGMLIGDPHTVSPLTSTITRETRDEPLDASRGAFLSQAFAFSPAWLGADLAYWKYFGQYFHYIPLQAPHRKPLTNEVLRPRLVYATGVRLGLARGIGGVVPMSERFFAGGSSSLRGFAQNAVGPIGADLIPTGGDALFVLNNELRVPLWWIVDGVVFADVGNVFNRISNFSITDLRQSGGIGLRVRTPWFLVRGDYGLVFDQRPGEPRSRFYFSIGQAF